MHTPFLRLQDRIPLCSLFLDKNKKEPERLKQKNKHHFRSSYFTKSLITEEPFLQLASVRVVPHNHSTTPLRLTAARAPSSPKSQPSRRRQPDRIHLCPQPLAPPLTATHQTTSPSVTLRLPGTPLFTESMKLSHLLINFVSSFLLFNIQ